MSVLNRTEIILALRARDGDMCQFPGCTQVFDFSLIGKEEPLAPTIDHWMPQYWCVEQGWSHERIWDLSNLRLMTKSCNAKKGGRVPNEDGTLPAKITREFRLRRDKRAARPVVCEACNSGRWLEIDQICELCGNTAQPMPFPALYTLAPNDCPHEGPWSCFACVLGIVPRIPAIVDVLDGSVLEDE